MIFDQAFTLLISPLFEGSRYVNDPSDPGGETKYGISKRAYPGEDIPSMSEARARLLYFWDYWKPLRCDVLPAPLRFPMFDFGVNSGPERAVRTLQSLLKTAVDGDLGPHTLSQVAGQDPVGLAIRLTSRRLTYLTLLENWPSHSKGWSRRISGVFETIATSR